MDQRALKHRLQDKARGDSPRGKKQHLENCVPPEHHDTEEETESRLFKLWVQASLFEARSVARRDDRQARDEYRRSTDDYLHETETLLDGHAKFYDPNRRAFVEYIQGVDIPTSKLWFQYRPVAMTTQECGVVSTYRRILRRAYDLRILSPETKRNRSTVETLERYQIRRFFGVSPKKLGVLAPASALLNGLEEYTLVDGAEVRVYRWADETPPGVGCNEAILYAMRDQCDLLVVCTRGELDVANDLDVFHPAYPVLLPEAVLLTPVQALQINGADPQAANLNDGLLQRICGVLGAVLLPRGAQGLVARLQRFDSQMWVRDGGLSSGKQGVERDARVCRLMPGLATHVPTCSHGWLSIDTRIALATALTVFQPSTILELGSWYGLSSRFIMEQAPPGSTFYTVDYFKNNAVYGRRMDTISPLDKLYQRHLRYETFCANMEPLLGGDKTCATVRMDIHEAVGLFEQHRVAVNMVFVDAEKNTVRLVDLLRRIMISFPRAVVVGDDYVFDSVKRAIADLRLGDRVLTREAAYIILPEASERPAAVEAMSRLEFDFALPPIHAEVCDLIKQKRYAEAIEAAQSNGMGLTADLYSPGKTVLHEICRQRDEEALQVLEKYCETAHSIPINELGLTPFDYFTHKIDFS